MSAPLILPTGTPVWLTWPKSRTWPEGKRWAAVIVRYIPIRAKGKRFTKAPGYLVRIDGIRRPRECTAANISLRGVHAA